MVHLEVHQTLHLLRLGNNIVCTWPYDPDAGKLAFALREIKWGLSVLIMVSVLMGTTCAIYYEFHNITIVTKAGVEFCASLEVLCNLILCKLQGARIQRLLEKLQNFLRTFNDHERLVLQKYINRYCGVYTLIVIWHAIAIVVFCCGPIFLPIKLPAETRYPFPIESSAVLSILYATQVYSIILAGCGISMDFMFSMFFCYSAAKLEILWTEMQNTINEKQIKSYIKKHQEIIQYVDETKQAVRYVLFKTNITMGLGIVCGAFPIIRVHSFKLAFQFICMVLGAYQRLSITAWPADDLKENSERFAFELYSIPWFEKSQSIVKDIGIMIQRCQKPLVITMGGLLPILSLEYYLKYATTIFSYFTTMKAVIDN